MELEFDVNDGAVRRRFLAEEMWPALQELQAQAAPRWGRMTPQQMVEHLLWAFEASTGRAQTRCDTPPEQLQLYRRFLYSNRPSPPEYMNPALAGGLPPLRYPGLFAAVAALRVEVDRFLAQPADVRPQRTHPLFGDIDVDGWSRAHYKHCHHHLAQFGLAGARGPTPTAYRPPPTA